MSGVKYPVDIKDIAKYEHQNSIGVNVYGCEDKKKTELGVTRHRLNLLHITVGETSHYVLLKDLSRLISRQIVITMTKDISDNIVYVTKPAKGD